MSAILTASEQAQLSQTIEMFEVITQSQPNDYQSLEILKEAYLKLGRDRDVIATSKRIAQAYVLSGQLSSAILEYETILQRFPDDQDVLAALRGIEDKASNIAPENKLPEPGTPTPSLATPKPRKSPGKGGGPEVDDGRLSMQKIFVETKLISAGDFDLCWTAPDLTQPARAVVEPFIQVLSDKGILPSEKSLRVLSDRTRMAYFPLEKYDLDLDLTRTFPMETCRRWCVLPFDRLSKSVLIATANPFNRQVIKELTEATNSRLLWYLASPSELVGNLRKAFR